MTPPPYASPVFRPLSTTQRVVDLLIAGAYLALFLLVPLASGGARLGTAGAVLLYAAALALRRWSPPLALGVAWAGAVVQMASGLSPDVIDAALPPIVYACAVHGARPVRWAAFASALAGGGVAGVYVAVTDYGIAAVAGSELAVAFSEFVRTGLITAVLLLLAWTAGLLVRTAAQSARNRQQAEQADRATAQEQERVRIARDMHDVVAHSLAVVIAQSDGARLLRRADPESVDEALETIGGVARAALSDVRVLLQQLRYEGTTEVQPGLRDLPALVEQYRASGLRVALEREGDVDAVGTSAQLAAFRIVQESLTNALRHGDLARDATVCLARTPHGLAVEVVSGVDPARPPRPSGGHGLIGMRERAATVQGDLRAGPDGGLFRVRGFLPAGSTAALPVVAAP